MALLDLWVGARYSFKLIRKQSHPRVATWLIFEIGVAMSLAAYFASNDHSIVKAALNLTDAVVVTVILALLFMERRGERLRFTQNEMLSLAIACITVAVWAISKSAWIAFAGFQAVMSVAYIPTIENVWRWRPGRPPEPVETWSINAVAALIGVGVDLTGSRDYVAMLYPLRAFILCMTIVVLVARWKRKSRMSQLASPVS